MRNSAQNLAHGTECSQCGPRQPFAHMNLVCGGVGCTIVASHARNLNATDSTDRVVTSHSFVDSASVQSWMMHSMVAYSLLRALASFSTHCLMDSTISQSPETETGLIHANFSKSCVPDNSFFQVLERHNVILARLQLSSSDECAALSSHSSGIVPSYVRVSSLEMIFATEKAASECCVLKSKLWTHKPHTSIMPNRKASRYAINLQLTIFTYKTSWKHLARVVVFKRVEHSQLLIPDYDVRMVLQRELICFCRVPDKVGPCCILKMCFVRQLPLPCPFSCGACANVVHPHLACSPCRLQVAHVAGKR